MAKKKRDEHGEYDTDAGSPHPVEEDEVGYKPCNAVLKYTFERYGERRYCTGMAISNFSEKGVETDYEHPDFCKHHQARAKIMKQHEDQFKTGAHAKSHEHIFQHLPPHKQLLANDLYKSLVDESSYNYEAEDMELEIDVRDSDFAPDADWLVLEHPVPTDYEIRAKALWFAALDFLTMESIKEEQFRVAAEESGPEGEDLSVGERTKVVSVTDEGRVIEDRDEHHLNIALSRIQKDYKQHMKFGGVEMDTENDTAQMSTREWVAVIEPDEPTPAPESASSDSSPLHEVEAEEDIVEIDEPDGDEGD